jgi:hypothetical protein
MRLKSVIALALVAGMAVGSIGVADARKKKKKKKRPVRYVAVDQTYWLRWDGDGQTCGDNYLSIVDGEDGGNGCEFSEQPLQEAYVATGGAARPILARDWVASDGLPFVLDARKPITGVINIFQAFSAEGSIEVKLTGTTGGQAVELGTATVDVPNAPFEVTPAEFEITPPASLNKKTFTGFTLNTLQRGVAVSYIELEDPASNLVIPTLKRRR